MLQYKITIRLQADGYNIKMQQSVVKAVVMQNMTRSCNQNDVNGYVLVEI